MSETTLFEDLTYDRVIDLAEQALGERCTNRCRPLNSYINRVYEIELESGETIGPVQGKIACLEVGFEDGHISFLGHQEYRLVNAKTGETIEIAASRAAKFKPGKGLKDALN